MRGRRNSTASGGESSSTENGNSTAYYGNFPALLQRFSTAFHLPLNTLPALLSRPRRLAVWCGGGGRTAAWVPLQLEAGPPPNGVADHGDGCGVAGLFPGI